MKRVRDFLLLLLFLPFILYLWIMWREYEGWYTKYTVRYDAGESRYG